MEFPIGNGVGLYLRLWCVLLSIYHRVMEYAHAHNIIHYIHVYLYACYCTRPESIDICVRDAVESSVRTCWLSIVPGGTDRARRSRRYPQKALPRTLRMDGLPELDLCPLHFVFTMRAVYWDETRRGRGEQHDQGGVARPVIGQVRFDRPTEN